MVSLLAVFDCAWLVFHISAVIVCVGSREVCEGSGDDGQSRLCDVITG